MIVCYILRNMYSLLSYKLYNWQYTSHSMHVYHHMHMWYISHDTYLWWKMFLYVYIRVCVGGGESEREISGRWKPNQPTVSESCSNKIPNLRPNENIIEVFPIVPWLMTISLLI